MAKKSSHPDKQLFRYLSGALEGQGARKIEAHLSDCPDCASFVAAVNAMRAEALPVAAAAAATPATSTHPDVSELASFFYEEAPAEQAARTARHVAVCRNCSDELALYARAEQVASSYEPSRPREEVPRAAWGMIRDWEESSYATLKPEGDAPSREMLTRLTRVLKEREGHLLEVKREAINSRALPAETSEVVPVLVVNQAGEFRRVEIFYKEEAGPAGVLKHSEGAGRFDEKVVHALLGPGGEEQRVVTEVIRRDAIELKRILRHAADLQPAYFIIED